MTHNFSNIKQTALQDQSSATPLHLQDNPNYNGIHWRRRTTFFAGHNTSATALPDRLTRKSSCVETASPRTPAPSQCPCSIRANSARKDARHGNSLTSASRSNARSHSSFSSAVDAYKKNAMLWRLRLPLGG